MYRTLSAPMNVQWEITEWCNHKCIHCYNHWRNEERKKIKCESQGKKIRDRITNELINNKIFHVTLTGGEPIAVIDDYITNIEKLRDNSITVCLNTNGTLITNEKALLIKKLGIKSVLVSLLSGNSFLNDKLTQVNGSFKKILTGIQILVKNAIPVAVNTVVTKKNIHTIRETGRLVKELGVNSFCATKVAPPHTCAGFNEYELSECEFQNMLEDMIFVRDTYNINVDSLEHYPACSFMTNDQRTTFGKRNCSAGKTGCTIGFNGQVRPCSHAHMTYGNIKKSGLKKVWFAMREWRNGKLVPFICKNECKEYPLNCGGGCRIIPYVKNKSLTDNDPYSKRIKPSTKKHRKIFDKLELESKISLNDSILSRNEEFGFIFYNDSQYWVSVDSKLGELLKTNRYVNVNDIKNLYNTSNNNALKTIEYLFNQKIVHLTNGNNAII